MEKTVDIFKEQPFQASLKKDELNDFIFFLNLKEDVIRVTESCVDFLKLPSATFSKSQETLLNAIAPEDRKIFYDGLESIKKENFADFRIECRMMNPKGSYVPIVIRGRYIKFADGTPIITGSIVILSTLLDDVTGLPQEAQMSSDYNDVRASNGNVSGFILAVRIEGLEHINSSFGLDVGDKIFGLVASACLAVKKDDVQVYRISGNKIALMNTSGKTAGEAQDLYNELKRKISEIEINLDYSVVFTISAGIVAFMKDRSELKDLIKKADFSLSMGKKSGKNHLYFFNSSEYSRHINQLSLRDRLRDSVKENFKGFEVYYQPIIDATQLGSEEYKINVIGAEALLRWTDENLGMLNADQIIPVLEESGLIAPVGRWVLNKAFNQCYAWNQYDKDFKMNVNISYVQIDRSDILADVEMTLGTAKVKPQNITLEITESGYIDHDELQRLLDEFHKMKINIDIDDFGTGYSNLRYIQNLHANTLKLDYSFVHKAVEGKDGDSERKVIEYIINMAHDLGMKVCLEGIESESDVAILSRLKPDKFQGFFFGKPVSSYAFFANNKKYFRDNPPTKE